MLKCKIEHFVIPCSNRTDIFIFIMKLLQSRFALLIILSQLAYITFFSLDCILRAKCNLDHVKPFML